MFNEDNEVSIYVARGPNSDYLSRNINIFNDLVEFVRGFASTKARRR